MAVFGILAPWLIPFLFGDAWRAADLICQALTPWAFLNHLSWSVAFLYIVAAVQERLLVFAVVYCAVPLALLWFSAWSLVATMWALSCVMTLLIVMCIMSVITAKQYDAGRLAAAVAA